MSLAGSTATRSVLHAARRSASTSHGRGAASAAASFPSSISTLPRATATSIRHLSSSAAVLADDSGKSKGGLFKSLLHGSESAKEDGLTAQSHSKRVGRGKYIHEIQRHVVRPDKVEEYISLLADYYPKVAADSQFPCRLVGSWQVCIGDCETFCESKSLFFGKSKVISKRIISLITIRPHLGVRWLWRLRCLRCYAYRLQGERM